MISLKNIFRPGAAKQITAAAAGDEIKAALSFPCELEITAAGDAKQPPHFSMLAYTGGPMVIAGWPYPVVVELSGLEIPGQKIPVRLQHDPNQGVGHTTKISIRENQLFAEGIISRDTESARDVSNSGKNGFPWQASINAAAIEYEFVKEGQKVKANGRTFSGPLDHIIKSKLKEISVVDLGADDDTEVDIAAQHETEKTSLNNQEKKNMIPVKELRGCAEEFNGLLDKQQIDSAVLEAAESEQDVSTLRANLFKKVQLAQVRRNVGNNSIGGAPEIFTGGAPNCEPRNIFAAAFLMAAGKHNTAEKAFSAEEMTAAASMRPHSVADICRWGLQVAGLSVPSTRSELISAGFSTADLAISLGVGVAGQAVLREAFLSIPMTCRIVGSKQNAANFKQHSLIEVCGIGSTYPVVGSTGELKHASFQDSKITFAPKTRGAIFVISRQDLINDNLGVFDQIAKLIGFNANRTENAIFWSVLKAAGTFFTEARGNLMPSSTLSLNTLPAAITLARNVKDADNNPVGAIPKFLVVSPANEFLARQLINSAEIRNAASEAAYGTGNPLSKTLEVVIEPLLGTGFGGADSTWYLFNDANITPGMILSYLNGIDVPTVETAQADFDTLGLQMRAYLDFNADLGDYRGVIKGTA